MKSFYYYKALRKTIIQFLDLFNDIQIARYDPNGNVKKMIKLPLKFSPKKKVWYWIHEKKEDEVLPILSSQMESLEYSTERQVNKFRKIVESSDEEVEKIISRYLNPVPYDITFTLNIWSLHMVDVDQILEQILPYFSPNAFIRVKIPELDATFEVKVLFQSANPDLTYDMSEEEVRILKWDLSFIVQTYLFLPVNDEKLIKEIISKIYVNKNVLDENIGTESTFTSGASGAEDEAIWLKALETVNPSAASASPMESIYYDEDVKLLYKYEIFD
jgi:hypothetical protein